MKPYHHILIVRTDRIGDVVLTTPAIAALRKAYPEARISMLVAPGTYDLVAGHPDLHEVLTDDRKGVHRGPAGFFRLAGELRRRRFDLAFVLHTKKRTNSLCFFAGIPERVGYHNDKFGFFLTQKIKDTRHEGLRHEMEYCLDVLRFLGIPAVYEKLYVSVNPEYERWAQGVVAEHRLDPARLAVVHPGASDPAKKWPAAGFRKVITELQKQYGFRVCLIGTADNMQTAQDISAGMENILDLTGRTSVGQMVSLLKRARLLISNDSGPVHVAAALNVPVISIFTRNRPGINPERWKPLGPTSVTLNPPPGDAHPVADEKVLAAIKSFLENDPHSATTPR